MALTDHDSIGGCERARRWLLEREWSRRQSDKNGEKGRKNGDNDGFVGSLFGVEASAEGGRVHILGYWLFDPRDNQAGLALLRQLQLIRDGRVTRAQEIIQKVS